MGSIRTPIVVRLLILACAIAAIAGPAAFAASALAEEGTTTTPSGETPTGGETVIEPVLPPVKETVETVTTPKKEATAPTEPTTAPQTTAPSGSSTATGGGSSGSSSPTATAPVKISAGPTQTSTPTHGGGGGGQGVHHASDLTGTTGGQTGASHSTAAGHQAGSSAVLGVTATSEAEESTGAAATEARELEGSSGRRDPVTVPTHQAAKPHVPSQVGDARPVEVDPKPAPDAASAALTTVGHVLSRPFKAPTSSSALLVDLCILFGVSVLGLAVWLELGGGWDRQRVADLVDMARRGRSTD